MKQFWKMALVFGVTVGLVGCGASTETDQITPTPEVNTQEEEEVLEDYSTLDLAIDGIRFSMGIPSKEGYACEYDEENMSIYITRNGEDVAQGFILDASSILFEMDNIRDAKEGYLIYQDEDVFALTTTAKKLTGFATEDGPLFRSNTPFLLYAMEDYNIGLIFAGLTSDEEFQTISDQLSIFAIPLS